MADSAKKKPVPLAEALASPPPKLFAELPSVMQQDGRVAGFEGLRDMLLANWRGLAAEFDIPLQALLKLVLETDRHALFAQVSEEKLGDADRSKQKKMKWFQDYLEGEVESVPLPEGDNESGREQDLQG